jgi:hypothetical protein
VKFGANCATSLLARRVEVVLRSPVMVSAHEACVGLWFSGATRFLGPQKLPCRAGSLVSRIGWEIYQAVMRVFGPRIPRTASAAKTCMAGIDFVEPGHDRERQLRRMVRSSRCGKRPRTNSSLRCHIPSRHHNHHNRRSLCSPGTRGSRGSRRSLYSHSHGLPGSPSPLPCSPCRRHKTSPD